MKTIKFDLNWNGKLYCNCFSTLRPRNDAKYHLNEVYNVLMANKDMGDVQIMFMKHFRLNQLTEAMALVDTGYGKKEATEILATIYPDIPNITDTEFTYIIVKRTVQDRNHNNQANEIRTIQPFAISALPGV